MFQKASAAEDAACDDPRDFCLEQRAALRREKLKIRRIGTEQSAAGKLDDESRACSRSGFQTDVAVVGEGDVLDD